MKVTNTVKNIAVYCLLFFLSYSQHAFAIAGATQEQTDLSVNQPYGIGTIYQKLLNVKVTPSAATGIAITNLQFKLTNPEQIARVCVIKSAYSIPDPTLASNFYGIAIDNPGANVSFDGSFTFTSTSAYSFYLIVDIKPGATVGTTIDATCTSVTTTDGTFTGIVTTNDRVAVIASNLTGSKTVKSSGGGDYTSLSSVITAINNFGVGTGGVTFNFADGDTFTHSSLTNSMMYIRQTGTASNPIIIKQSGNGTKPIINCAATVSTDVFIGGLGVDYITIEGLDFRATSTTSTAKFERPIYFVGLPSHGCNNNEIKNCNINAGDTYNNARIYGISFRTNAITAAGANTNNKIHDNSLSNLDAAVDFNDALSVAPSVKDDGNEIYNNIITGQFATMVGGIRIAHCNNTKIYNNLLDGIGITTTYTGPRYGISTYLATCTGYVYCYNNNLPC